MHCGDPQTGDSGDETDDEVAACVRAEAAKIEEAATARAGQVLLPSETLSCLACFGLLDSPWTFACGHTLCNACAKRLRKCPLPWENCRSAPSFVYLTSAGAVARHPGGGRVPAADAIGGARRDSDVRVTVNLSLDWLMRRIVPRAAEANDLKASANELLRQGDAAGAEDMYARAISALAAVPAGAAAVLDAVRDGVVCEQDCVGLAGLPGMHILYCNLALALLNQDKFAAVWRPPCLLYRYIDVDIDIDINRYG